MVYIDNVEITPNPVDVGKEFLIAVTVHEEYENAKRYQNRYPYRYGRKEED